MAIWNLLLDFVLAATQFTYVVMAVVIMGVFAMVCRLALNRYY